MEGEEGKERRLCCLVTVFLCGLCVVPCFVWLHSSGSIRLKCSVHFDVCFYPNICCPGVCKEF